MSPAIIDNFLPWADKLPTRDMATIRLVVLHSTEEPTLGSARCIAEGSSDMLAAHYYIDRDGITECWIPVTRIANHVLGYNPESLGIELVNSGRYPNHFDSRNQIPTDVFPPVQVEKVIELLHHLKTCLPLGARLAMHSQLDNKVVQSTDNPGRVVDRKIDPGPMFPWEKVLKAWLGGHQ